MQRKWITIAFIGIFSTQIEATVIYDDGGLHTISGVVVDDILLEHGSDLNVEGFAFIQPLAGAPAIVQDNTSPPAGPSTINLSGNATVMGEILYRRWFNEDSIVTIGDNAMIVGQGEYISGSGRGAVSGMRRAEVSGNARLLGAHNAVDGGSAINNRSSGALFVSVSGGEITGGNGGQTGGDGISGRFDVVNIEMTGGVIQGGTGGNEGGHGIGVPDIAIGTISGGEIIGGNGGQAGGHALFSDAGFDLNITGGEFQGGNGGNTGGDALRLHSSFFDPGTATISGGSFDAGVGLFDDGWLLYLAGMGGNIDITGGLFGYGNIGNGFGIFRGAHVNVYGWDLSIVDGLLTGFLMDNSWIETPVSLAFNEFSTLGTISLFNTPHPSSSVPEPSTLLLMAIGIAGIGIAKRKRTS
ncbi:MAG: PEP-CTERM sorting domain-containing protein [Candidatus Thiodiazotropha sp. (ex Codakia rugifera)]|nr:PEP-CTERM sorting domain-containing protein [Candidatus Thiodiazotropha sp. (ex Codakia rugifera)]